MDFLDSLQVWIKGTALYNDFLLHMPAPLNNIYFDTILLALVLIYCGYRVIDSVQMSKRHRAVKKRQLELQEKTAENEIHMINHEREARNNREEMNQFMRFMEMSVLAGTTKQVNGIGSQPTFEQFKEQERQERIAADNEKTQEAFDTIDADNGSVELPAQDAIDVEQTRSENERITAELEALRMEKLQMQREFAEKEKSREAALARVKASMKQKENDKQAEIDKLQAALAVEKEHAEKQIDTMSKNLSVYKANKEKEIADLTARLSQTGNMTEDEKQAEIVRLRSEMKQMEEDKKRAIAAKEREYQEITDKKQQEINDLNKEMSELKNKNSADMTQINRAYEAAQSEQKDIEDQKSEELKQLTEKIDHMQKEKEEEITAIQKRHEKEVANLQAALSDANQRAEAYNKANLEQSEEIARMQSMLAVKEASADAPDRETINQQLAQMRMDRDLSQSEKEAAEKEAEELNMQISKAQASGKKQIAEKQAEIQQLQSAKDATVSENEAVQIPKQVVKPFGGETVADKDNLFYQTIAQFEQDTDKSQHIETARMSQEEKARMNKEYLEQQLAVDAQEDDRREMHGEDEATLRAIEERKKALRAEEARADSGSKKKKSFFKK